MVSVKGCESNSAKRYTLACVCCEKGVTMCLFYDFWFNQIALPTPTWPSSALLTGLFFKTKLVIEIPLSISERQ